MRKSGFSLLELLMVVLIVGILAAAALPNFSRGAERAKVKDAQSVIAALISAERVYYLDQGSYGTDTNLYSSRYVINPDAGNSNPDWTFGATGGTTTTVTATRTGGGSFSGNTINGTTGFNGTQYGGNHPLRDQ